MRRQGFDGRKLLATAGFGLLLIATAATHLNAAAPGEREKKVRADKANLENDENWIYDDWNKAVAEAKATNKPLLVVLRCIPCEACSKFDDEVVRRNEAVRALMDQFVCVRIVKANGLDLNLFQYDYDQSFHAFLTNADGTIYGRFGTRSESKDETQDMTMQGFARALELALAWHGEYPRNKDRFAGKHGPQPLVERPEQYPLLSGKYDSKLDYEGNKLVQSCIHCHQVREAERHYYREAGKPMPENVLYPFPLPKVVGLTMNSLEAGEVKAVEEGTPAARAGFRSGDRIQAFNGSPVLSIADMQWVLHRFDSSGSLPVQVRRGDEAVNLVLDLPEGWRTKSDLSWRPTSWDLRRMAFGGMKMKSLTAEERTPYKLAGDRLALLIEHVGQYGDHAKAKQAGFVKGDVLVKYAGSTEPATETELMARSMQKHKPGDQIPVTVLRGGKEIDLKIPVQ
ncbi:MAG: Trx7/PDZ domain-containing (seleno)protein [Pirellulales bacterium]